MTRDEKYMEIAIEEARLALAEGEIPVGAVIVRGESILARAHNTRENALSVLGHAEITAIEKACHTLGDWRLDGCELFVTLEPCAMCAGAVNAARLKRVVFGAFDPELGCLGSALDISRLPNSRVAELLGGIRDAECKNLLNSFFASARSSDNKK